MFRPLDRRASRLLLLSIRQATSLLQSEQHVQDYAIQSTILLSLQQTVRYYQCPGLVTLVHIGIGHQRVEK